MAWKYVKNKGWTDGSRVFKRKYIKLNNGDYKSLNSDGTVTLVYTNGKFTKDGQIMTSNKDKEGIRNGLIQDANAQSSYWRPDNNQKTFKLSDYKINTVNPNSPEGIAQQVQQRLKLTPMGQDSEKKKYNEKLMASENVWDQKVGQALEESRQKQHLTEEGKRSSVMQHVVKKGVESKANRLKPKKYKLLDITVGQIAQLLAENDGKTDLDQLYNKFIANNREQYHNYIYGQNGDEESLKHSLKVALDKYNEVKDYAYSGANSTSEISRAAKQTVDYAYDVLGLTDQPFKEKQEAKKAEHLFNVIGNENIPTNWNNNQYLIRHAFDTGDSYLIDKKPQVVINGGQSGDFIKRSLRLGEDLTLDAAKILLADTGMATLSEGTAALLGRLSPEAITALDNFAFKTNRFIDRLGTRAGKTAQKLLPKNPRSVVKPVKTVVSTPLHIATDMITHPLSTFGEAVAFDKVYFPAYDKYAKPALSFLPDVVTEDIIPDVAMIAKTGRTRNRSSQQILDAVADKVTLKPRGLARTYQNYWATPEGVSRLKETARSPYSAELANVLNPLKEGVLYGLPLATLSHFEMNPGHFVENATGSPILGTATDLLTTGYFGNKTNQAIARAEYLRGLGSTTIKELGDNIKAGRTIKEIHGKDGTVVDRKQTDKVAYWIANHVGSTPAGIYRMAGSYLPWNFLSRTGSYSGLFKGTPSVSVQKAGDYIKSDKNVIGGKAMTSALDDPNLKDIQTGQGKPYRMYQVVAGSDLKDIDPITKSAIETAFSLGRFKKGQIVDITLSGDWERFRDGVLSGRIIPFHGGGYDENGNLLPLFDENNMPYQIGQQVLGRQGAFPLGGIPERTKTTNKAMGAYFDTQGHLVDTWYDTETGEILYRGMDNSGLGRASRSNEGKGWLTKLKEVESAFIDLNMPQAFNINISGGPSGIGGTSLMQSVHIPIPKMYIEQAKKDMQQEILQAGHYITDPSGRRIFRPSYALKTNSGQIIYQDEKGYYTITDGEKKYKPKSFDIHEEYDKVLEHRARALYKKSPTYAQDKKAYKAAHDELIKTKTGKRTLNVFKNPAQQSFLHIVQQWYPWDPTKISYQDYRLQLNLRALELAERSTFGMLHPDIIQERRKYILSGFKDRTPMVDENGNVVKDKKGKTVFMPDDKPVGPLGLPTINIAKSWGLL